MRVRKIEVLRCIINHWVIFEKCDQLLYLWNNFVINGLWKSIIFLVLVKFLSVRVVINIWKAVSLFKTYDAEEFTELKNYYVKINDQYEKFDERYGIKKKNTNNRNLNEKKTSKTLR